MPRRVGKSDIPDPARGLRARNRLRGDRRGVVCVGHLHRQRGVAEKHVAAIFEWHAERLADEQRLETRAVDEQVAFDLARLHGVETADIAVLGEIHATHVGEHMPHTELLAAMLLQERRELARVEMIGVVRNRFELGGGDGLGRKAVVAETSLRSRRRRRSCGRRRAPASAARGSPARSSAEASAGGNRSHQPRPSSSARSARPV